VVGDGELPSTPSYPLFSTSSQLIEDFCFEQEQVTTDHSFATMQTSLGTPMDFTKLKKCTASTSFSPAERLPENRFSHESLSPRRPKDRSSRSHSFKQAKSIQTLPPSYQTKSNSVKANGISLFDPSTTVQSRTEGNPPKHDATLVLQPETKPISQEKLVAEVKGIYAGLVMVEAKCVEVDSKQAAAGQDPESRQPKLGNEQWQALIAWHRTLLHEHHDFFLASQHPSASPALGRLAAKYTMPARMWRHGIHSFLELLRHRLPDSLEHMLAFIYIAYSMMALLYEAVPTLEETWIECLGDLGKYRMATEDEDIRDRDHWSGVARSWYSKASDKSAAIGRLYHHLAMLAQPSIIQQWSLYVRALVGGLYLKYKDFTEPRIHDVFRAAGRKMQFGLSISESMMLRIRSCHATAALCSPSTLPYGSLLHLLVTPLQCLTLLRCALCCVTTRIQAMASEVTVASASQAALGTGDLRDTAKGRVAKDKRELVQRLPQLRELVPVAGDGTNADVALNTADGSLSMGVAGTKVSFELGVRGRSGRRSCGTVTDVYSLSARLIGHLAMLTLFMQPILAVAVKPGDLSAVGRIANSSSGHLATAKRVPTDLNLPGPSEWFFPILCAGMLFICWAVAKLKRWELSNVWGTLAAISWWLWLYLLRDPDVSPWFSWT